MEEWKKCRLGEICKIYGRIGFRGYTVEDLVEDADKGAISLSPTNLIGGVLDLSKPTYISWDKYYESPEIMIEEDDVVIVKTGSSVGRTAIIRNVLHPMTLNPQLVVLKDVVINKRYLGYLVKSRDFQGKLASIVVGSAIPTLSQKNLANLVIRVPSKETQERIACILSALDDKIELNNRINHNLEEQAQAIYKSWFVDFEPFKNGKFIESELGLIPEGWKIGKINDVINLLSGFPFKSSDFQENGNYQLITIKGVQDGYLDVTSADMLSSLPSKMPQYCILNIGDILISLTGNVGRICIVDRNNLLLNQRVAILSPKNIRDSFYVYTMFRSESMKNELIHIARGTAQLNLSPIETGEKLTVIPPDSILESFSKVGKDTFNQYISLKMENIRLMEMRDALLPKLMSGDLKLNEIDC